MRIRNRDRGQINAASIRLARRRKDRRNQPSEGGDQLPPLDGAAFKYSVSISVVKYHPIRVQARTLERNTATAKAADKVGVGTARPHIRPRLVPPPLRVPHPTLNHPPSAGGGLPVLPGVGRGPACSRSAVGARTAGTPLVGKLAQPPTAALASAASGVLK
jgi:hypothetical protein